MLRYPRHNWWYWKDFADAYIRVFRKDRLPTDHPYTIINTRIFGGDTTTRIIEFNEPLESTTCYADYRVSSSFSPMVFPFLIHPRWHHGYSMTINKGLGVRLWMEDNIQNPLTIIDGVKLLYITTDNVDDFTLIKLRFQEYQGDASD